MASLFIRGKRYYLKYKSEDGQWKLKATEFSTDNAQHKKLALALEAAATSRELGSRRITSEEKWESWVENYFQTAVKKQNTANGYRQSWAWLRMYLEEKGVTTPAKVDYGVAFEYVQWRRKNGLKKTTSDSTAQRDLKVLRILMNHAVHRGWAQGNPLLKMKLPRPQPKKKAEYTDDDVKKLFKAFEKNCTENDWRYVAWRIGAELGIRLMSTQIPWEDVNFDTNVIKVKGKSINGNERFYETIIPTSLRPLLLKQKALGGKYTVELPENNASQKFGNFLTRVAKLPNHCFHGTRVTFNARLERNPDITGRIAMQALNHSSPAVHAVYSRPNVEDLRQIDKKVVYPKPPKFRLKAQTELASDTKSQNQKA